MSRVGRDPHAHRLGHGSRDYAVTNDVRRFAIDGAQRSVARATATLEATTATLTPDESAALELLRTSPAIRAAFDAAAKLETARDELRRAEALR